MAKNQKRKNPGTPSPQKRSTRTAKHCMGQNADILLPGGARQTIFPAVEGLSFTVHNNININKSLVH